MPKLPLLSIVIPGYNESGNILPMYKALLKNTAGLQYRFEFIFVVDGSSDDSVEKIMKLSRKDHSVKMIELARNFGKEIALTAGLHQIKGEAVIMLDSDLQHPPTLIPKFIKKWEKGADVVVGVRKTHEEKWHKRTASAVFYKLMNTLASGTEIVPHETDFRLVDRQVVDAFNNFTERNRITRGLFNWLGFTREVVPFEAPPRTVGEATYSLRKRLKLALDSFVGHTVILLRLASYIGIVITITSGLFGLFIFVERYILDDPLEFHFSGPAILAVIILFLIGIVLTCLGFMSLYIAQIHQEVMNRPLYVLRRKRNGNIG